MTPTERRRGLAAALGAYTLWGLLPIYFMVVERVPTFEIIANRIFWSAVLVVILVLVRGQWRALRRAFATRKLIWGLAGSAICITINWSFYAWAVPHGHAVEAGFGYLINPLFTVLLGLAVLRERISAKRLAAVLCAAAGVAVLVVGHVEAVWLVVVLPLSFGLYGLLRKLVPVDALVGLAVEVMLVGPIAAAYLATRPEGGALFGQGLGITGLLMLSAPATAVPLVLFAYGARRMPLATLGLLQYVSPTLQLASAVLVLGETVTWTHAAAFSLIWLGIAVDWLPLGRRSGRAPAGAAAVDIDGRRGHMAQKGLRTPIASTSNPEAP